jgi:adenylylsulfate kinase
MEVFVDVPLEECERRDPKGLYRKARAGEIKQFTGIDSEYERPSQAEIHLSGEGNDVQQLVSQCVDVLKLQRIIE